MIIKQLSKELAIENAKEIISILDQDEYNYWDEQNLLFELPDKWKISFLMFKDRQLVGLIIASRKETYIHIHKLFVHSCFKRLNIATQLLHASLISSPIFIKYCTLVVYKNNMAAITFYSKMGFKMIKQTEDAYGIRYELASEINNILTCIKSK